VSNLVEIRDLHFSYGDRPILSNLRMDFPRGKLIAVMGGSGCGKTTVLRLIGGQIRPQKGTVAVNGEVVHQLDTAGCTACAARWACCSSSARCSPT
jgi:phospholipid/cholesterol/gamma-HCH transport system ATP-binding protein